METYSDLLDRLSNHSIFKSIHYGTNNSKEKISNILQFKDDVIFVWNSEKNCLHTLNLQSLGHEGDEDKYQVLIPIVPPYFEVEHLTICPVGSKVCAWGKNGVAVIELPSRWGKLGFYENGNPTIMCRSGSSCLDEKFLMFQTEVRRVRWHPASLSHVVVLVADNTIRIYNTSPRSGSSLSKVLSIGPKPSARLAGKQLLESLGDTAVDFAFANNQCIVLRGNGDIYMISYGIGSKQENVLIGPLIMHPPADDNYGEESCCIEVLEVSMCEYPVVIIATATAMIYHCILMLEDYSESTADDQNNDSEYDIYVAEILELGITLSQNEQLFPYPVNIYPGVNHSSYICMHAGGVHTVSMAFVNNMKKYLLTGAEEDSNIQREQCRSVFSICTASPGSAPEPSPPLGLICLRVPPAMLVILPDGEVVTRTLGIDDFEEQLHKELLLDKTVESDNFSTLIKQKQSMSFLSVVKEVLARDVSQPILKIAPSQQQLDPQEIVEFFVETKQRLHSSYIEKQMMAYDVIKTKHQSMLALAEQQFKWYHDIQNDIKDLQAGATRLQEKLEKAEENRENIMEKCSEVFRVMRASSVTVQAERNLLDELYKCRKEIDEQEKMLNKLKIQQKYEVEDHNKNKIELSEKKELFLGRSHSETIAIVIKQNTVLIARLMNQIKELKEDLGLF